MKYTKSAKLTGSWVKGSDIEKGTRCKLVSEARDVQSQFEDKNGAPQMQTVAQIRFQGKDETFNVSLNRATREGLIDAFGDESKNWANKVLTAETMKVMVSGKMRTALYLVPEGFQLGEDENGYVVITSKNNGNQEALNAVNQDVKTFDQESEGDYRPEDVEYPSEDINPEDIPF